MRVWRDGSASKVLAMQPWASEFGFQHLHEKLNIVSCMPVTYAHNPSTVWGRDKRVLELGGHWPSRLRERPCLIGISQRVIEDIQCLPLAFMGAGRHVYLHTQIPKEHTHTEVPRWHITRVLWIKGVWQCMWPGNRDASPLEGRVLWVEATKTRATSALRLRMGIEYKELTTAQVWEKLTKY